MTGRPLAAALAALLALAVLIDVLVAGAHSSAGPQRWQHRWRIEHQLVQEIRRRYRMRLELLTRQPRVAIALIFGRYTGQAVTVAKCETGGTFSTQAQNGQYLGLFQMGSSERARYGHGPTALEQARAAYVYFVVSGRNWGPWTCKP